MKKRITIFLLIALIALGGLYFWYTDALNAADPTDTEGRIFVVARGDSVRSIANNLKKEGFIRDPLAFFILIKKQGLETSIQAGDFRLSSSMNAGLILDQLQHGTLDVWVTIPEGWRSEEIALKLAQELSIPESSFLQFAQEGYMFPDTYLFPKDASASAIAKVMRANFDKKVEVQFPNWTQNKKLTPLEIITLASLVEREARLDEDRPKVASVILNRLDIGMKLDIDATVQYALGYQQNAKSWWKKGLTREDLAVASPYNTYMNKGLPPGPIANPGLAAIEAVISPATTDYLYYLTDTDGVTHYAATFEEHTRNIATYLAN